MPGSGNTLNRPLSYGKIKLVYDIDLFGKFYILINAIASEKLWIALIMIATTVVSYFYYFEFIRQMFFRPSPREGKLAVSGVTAAVILVAVLGTVGLGVFPQNVLQFLGGINWDGAFVQMGPPQ